MVSFSVNHAAGDGGIAIDAAVAQKRPVAPDILQVPQVHFTYEDFFFVVRSFGENATKRIAQERSSPEFQPFAGGRIATNIAGLKTNTIHHADVHSVRDGVRTLDGAPGIVLRDPELGLLRGMPSDRSWIK